MSLWSKHSRERITIHGRIKSDLSYGRQILVRLWYIENSEMAEKLRHGQSTWKSYRACRNVFGELEELDDSEKISYFHTVQLVKTEEIDNMWRPGMIGFFGNSLLVIMVNLRNVVDKVNYLIKQEGM